MQGFYSNEDAASFYGDLHSRIILYRPICSKSEVVCPTKKLYLQKTPNNGDCFRQSWLCIVQGFYSNEDAASFYGDLHSRIILYRPICSKSEVVYPTKKLYLQKTPNNGDCFRQSWLCRDSIAMKMRHHFMGTCIVG